MRSRRCVFSALAFLLAACHAPAGATAAALLSHRAVYSLTRAHSSVATDVTGVRGRLEMTLEAACDGWRMEQFIGFQIYHPDGPGLEHLARQRGWESADGIEYRFSTRSYVDREVQDEFDGVAHLEAPGRPGESRFSARDPVTRALPAGTMFPARHLAALVAAAVNGERHLTSTVFDGSTMDSPYEITTFIGAVRAPGANAPAALEGMRSWPLRLAYFKLGSVQPSPEFEMSAELYENGVAGDMIYDYGDFAIDVKLSELHELPTAECEKQN